MLDIVMADRPRFRRALAIATCLLIGAGAAAPVARAADNTLLVLSDGVPGGLDPDGASALYAPSHSGMLNLMEPLLRFDLGPQNAAGVREYKFDSFKPALAESWSFEPGTLTWTFKLRQGVKSCAGNPLTADDVLYTFARAKSRSGTTATGMFLAGFASVANFTKDLYANTPEAAARRVLGDEVTKLDAHTVQIRQSAANPLFTTVLPVFGMLIYDHVEMQKHATPDDPWSHVYNGNVDAPSFGAYCLEAWHKEQDFSLRANPDYYEGKPYFDRVVFRKVPQSSNRIAILRNGQAQIADGFSPQELNNFRTARGLKVSGGYLNNTLLMLPNWQNKPFDDIRVRRALAYAIPYDEIIKSSYFGDAKQFLGLIPSAYPGYHQPTAHYETDLAKARALLAEAGYPEGKGLDAFANSFKLTYPAEREGMLGPVATLMQTRLKAVGFPIQLDPIPAGQYADRQFVKRDLPLGLYDQLRPTGVHALFATQLYFVTRPLGVVDMTNYSNATVDRLFGEAVNTLDETKRSTDLKSIQDTLMDELALLPIVEAKTQFAMDSTIQGLAVHPAQILVLKYLHR